MILHSVRCCSSKCQKGEVVYTDQSRVMPICPLVKLASWKEGWPCSWLLASLGTEPNTPIVFPHFNSTGSLLVGENDMLVPNDIYDVQHKRFPVFGLYDMTCGLAEENITEKAL